jgi:hypothetical protein
VIEPAFLREDLVARPNRTSVLGVRRGDLGLRGRERGALGQGLTTVTEPIEREVALLEVEERFERRHCTDATRVGRQNSRTSASWN